MYVLKRLLTNNFWNTGQIKFRNDVKDNNLKKILLLCISSLHHFLICTNSWIWKPQMKIRVEKYEVWLWSSKNDFTASIPVYQYTSILAAYWQRSPWAAMNLAEWCCQCWKHFWNSCCGIAFSAIITFSWMSSTSWNLYPFKADFIFGNSEKSFRAKQGEQHGCYISVIDLGQKLLDRECLVRWSTVMVENPITGPKFSPFSMHNFK
jgi:hypothetical protein